MIDFVRCRIVYFLIFIEVFFYSCSPLEASKEREEKNAECTGLCSAYITTDEANTLYYGVENMMEVKVSGISSACVSFELKRGEGTIKKERGPFLSVKPTSFDTISILFWDRCEKEFREFLFDVKQE